MIDGSFLADKDFRDGWWSILARSLVAVETDSWPMYYFYTNHQSKTTPTNGFQTMKSLYRWPPYGYNLVSLSTVWDPKVSTSDRVWLYMQYIIRWSKFRPRTCWSVDPQKEWHVLLVNWLQKRKPSINCQAECIIPPEDPKIMSEVWVLNINSVIISMV